MSNTTISPGDHENTALAEIQRNELQEAQVHALLALASAVNRLAEAHETMANAVTDMSLRR
jgi:hypothetical protein